MVHFKKKAYEKDLSSYFERDKIQELEGETMEIGFWWIISHVLWPYIRKANGESVSEVTDRKGFLDP